MIAKQRYPGIVRAAVTSDEFTLIKDTVRDLTGLLDGFTEARLLDELELRGREARGRLPAIRDLLESMADAGGPGVVVLELPNSSVDGIGPTPVEHIRPGQRNLFAPDLYRGLLLGMTGWYGYGFTTQQRGLIHNNVIATRRFSDTPLHSASAKHELSLHTEEASYSVAEGLDISPDFFSLHFFRNPDRVPTTFAIPDWAQLPAGTLDQLRRPLFMNRTNPAQGGERNDPGVPVSIVYGQPERPRLRLNTARLDVDAYDPRCRAALVELNAHLARRTATLVLPAGSIAVVDNRRVVHGRPPYQGRQAPRYDGTDRWSRRVAASVDAGRIRRFESTHRVVDTDRFLAAVRAESATAVGQGGERS